MARHRCPHCSAAVLNRRRRLCARCGQPLPEDLLLSPEQREAIETEDARQRERHARRRRPKLPADGVETANDLAANMVMLSG